MAAAHATTPLLAAADRPRAAACAEYLFKYLLLVQVAMYLEAGAVPALLQQFTLAFELSPQEQGLLGAVVYLAISLTSPWCAALFRRFSPRTLLGVSLAANNLAVLGLATVPAGKDGHHHKALLVGLRAAIGLTQAFHCVYCPLWVHDYAPLAKRGAWMSYLQAAVPIGVTLGYLAGSVTLWAAPDGATVCSGIACWRWPFLFQFALVLPLSVALFLVPARHIRLRTLTRRRSIVIVDAAEDDDTVDAIAFAAEETLEAEAFGFRRGTRSLSVDVMEVVDHVSTRFASLVLLARHRVYVFVVLALSALFFVVTGVQFWTTLYLETNTRDSLYEIHTAYLLVAGTGPILGVFFGGWLIDRCGGYAGAARQAQALRVCLALGAVACLAALPVSFFRYTAAIAAGLWLMLFCGAAILPACSGIVISAAPPALRPLAASVAYTCYNLLGYAASNYIPGLIMDFIIDASCDAACTYRIGFRIVLFWSVIAFCSLAAATMASSRHVAAVQAKQGKTSALSPVTAA